MFLSFLLERLDLRPEEKIRSVPWTYCNLVGEDQCMFLGAQEEESEAREHNPLCANLISSFAMSRAMAVYGSSDVAFTQLP